MARSLRVSVVCVLEGLRRLHRARKPTASNSPPAIAKAGDMWQEWAGVRPERLFAQPWSYDILLGAVLRCDVPRTMVVPV